MSIRRRASIPALAVVLAVAAAVPALAAPDPSGYLHGTVETSSGNRYTGLIRWSNEEAFWDDLFNSSKTELPWLERYGDRRRERSRIRIFGITIGYHWDNDRSGRVFIARFGDIREIRPGRGDRVEVEMRSGVVHVVDGGSNDVGADVVVQDASLGSVELEWDRIGRITFSGAPADARPQARRLQGRVMTEDGETYQGFIQWDLQECVWTDRLDGDTEDGDLSIDFGKIAAIEKHDRHGSWVELRDGRRLLLEDTNDVDSSLRGIFVEDERFGRVEISWEAFRRAEFAESDGSGRGYAAYPELGELRGRVVDIDGREHEGTLVFDLDEAEGWEMLNGERAGVKFNVPFSRIRVIEPQRRGSRIVLDGGREFLLDEGQDVSERNDGVVVLGGDREPIHVPWDRVRRVELR